MAEYGGVVISDLKGIGDISQSNIELVVYKKVGVFPEIFSS